jgi:hypothetical protein
MRRFLGYFAVLGFLGTFLTGCCSSGGFGGGHVHGMCDCYQLSPCATRQPWVMQDVAPPIAAPIPVAAPLPADAPPPAPAPQQIEGKKL